MHSHSDKLDFRVLAPHSLDECQRRLESQNPKSFWSRNRLRVRVEPHSSDHYSLHIHKTEGKNFRLILSGEMRRFDPDYTLIEGKVRLAYWVWLFLVIHAFVFGAVLIWWLQESVFGILSVGIYGLGLMFMYFSFQRYKRELIALVAETVEAQDMPGEFYE